MPDLNLSRRTLLGAAAGAALLTSLDFTMSAPSAHAAIPPFKQLVSPVLQFVPPNWPKAEPRYTWAPGYLPSHFKPVPNGVPISPMDKSGTEGQHPSRLADLMLGHLDSYENTGNRGNLTFACEILDRMIEGTAVFDRGAVFFPYTFDWPGAAHGPNIAPWFSSYSQARYPLVVWRMYTLTQDRKYLGILKQVMTSFELPPAVGRPWIIDVDDNGCYWFEEAPYPDGHASHIHNGNLLAGFDMLAYAERSGDQRAYELVRGAFYTAHYYRNACRNPGWCSYYYALTSKNTHASYHPVHAQMFVRAYNATRIANFAKTTDQLIGDYCSYTLKGGLNIFPVAHKVKADYYDPGVLWKPPATISIPSANRISIKGQTGVWSRMDTGPHAGKYIQEGPYAYRSWYDTDAFNYRFPRKVIFKKGRIGAFEYAPNGRRVLKKTITFTRDSSASSYKRAKLGGRQCIHISNGGFAGLWVPEGTGAFYA